MQILTVLLVPGSLLVLTGTNTKWNLNSRAQLWSILVTQFKKPKMIIILTILLGLHRVWCRFDSLNCVLGLFHKTTVKCGSQL